MLTKSTYIHDFIHIFLKILNANKKMFTILAFTTGKLKMHFFMNILSWNWSTFDSFRRNLYTYLWGWLLPFSPPQLLDKWSRHESLKKQTSNVTRRRHEESLDHVCSERRFGSQIILPIFIINNNQVTCIFVFLSQYSFLRGNRTRRLK